MYAHLDFIENLPSLVVAKDMHSVYLHISDPLAKLIGRKSSLDCRGITDYDIRCKAVEFADIFIKTDKIVMNSGSQMMNLDIQNYTYGWKLILVERNPLKNKKGEIVGLLSQCIDVTDSELFKPYLRLTQLDHKLAGKSYKPMSYILSETHTPLPLTERQEQILFFLIRGRSQSEIAARLNLSRRTIECHLDAIKNKLGCQYKSELIEKALDSGFLYYVPKGLQDSKIVSW